MIQVRHLCTRMSDSSDLWRRGLLGLGLRATGYYVITKTPRAQHLHD